MAIMAQARRNTRRNDGQLSLLLSPTARAVCAVMNLVPIAGVGAAVAGWRNPHTRLLRNGVLQCLLVLFGSWPLIVPGVIGFAWAGWDTWRIATATLRRLPPRGGVDPEATPQKATPR